MSGECFECYRNQFSFVGRRGTGKTAITRYIESTNKNSLQIHPKIFSPLEFPYEAKEFEDTHQRYFQSLVESFKHSLQTEVLREWFVRELLAEINLPRQIERELGDSLSDGFDIHLAARHVEVADHGLE